MLETNGSQRADEAETYCGVQRDRRGIRRIANHSDHLPEAAGLRVGEEPRDKKPA
jgi:hypothetical protein